VERLSPAGKQLVGICRAIQHGSSLLIFDEPTSSLSGGETEEVFRIVRTLRGPRHGRHLYHATAWKSCGPLATASRSLRDGATVHTSPLKEVSTGRIIQHMVGRELVSIYQRPPVAPGAELLRVEGLTRRGALRDVSFSLHAGRNCGLSRSRGRGPDRNLPRNIRSPIHRRGQDLRERPSGTHENRRGRPWRRASRLVTEDRQKTGLALRLPIAYNITMANLREISRLGVIDRGAEGRVTAGYIARLRIRASSGRQAAGPPERRQSAKSGDRQVAVPPRAGVPFR